MSGLSHRPNPLGYRQGLPVGPVAAPVVTRQVATATFVASSSACAHRAHRPARPLSDLDGESGPIAALDVPRLGSLRNGGGSNRFDQILSLFTSMACPPERAQEPWGLDIGRPQGATDGVLGLMRADEGALSKVRLTLREHLSPALSCNRLLFVFGTGLPLHLALGLSWLATGVLLSAVNVVGSLRHSVDCTWSRQLPAETAARILAREERFWARLALMAGFGRPQGWWHCRHILPAPWHALMDPGDRMTMDHSDGQGISLAFVVLWGLLRLGAPAASGSQRRLGLTRTSADSMKIEVQLTGGARGLGTGAGALWVAGSWARGHASETSYERHVAWPSAAGLLACQLAADQIGRPPKGPAPKGTLPFAVSRKLSETTLVHGFGWHLPLLLPHARSIGSGHAHVRSQLVQYATNGETTSSCHTVAVGGLIESLAAGREEWRCEIFVAEANLLAPNRAREVELGWQYTSVLDWGTARTLPGWLARTGRLADELMHPGVDSAAACDPASITPFAVAAPVGQLWLRLSGRRRLTADSLFALKPPRELSTGLWPTLSPWLRNRRDGNARRLADFLLAEQASGFVALQRLLAPSADCLEQWQMSAGTSETAKLNAAKVACLATTASPAQQGRGLKALAEQEAAWQQLAARLPKRAADAAQRAAAELRAGADSLSTCTRGVSTPGGPPQRAATVPHG